MNRISVTIKGFINDADACVNSRATSKSVTLLYRLSMPFRSVNLTLNNDALIIASFFIYAAFLCLLFSGQRSTSLTPRARAMAWRTRADVFLPETIKETVEGFTFSFRQISICFMPMAVITALTSPVKPINALTLLFISFLFPLSKLLYVPMRKYKQNVDDCQAKSEP